MVEVPQDVSGTLLSERQVAVLKLRQDDVPYEDIADELDTTPEGVETLEQTALEHVRTAYRTVRVAESLRSTVRVEAEAGMSLLDVVRELRTAGDQVGVKLGSTEQRLHDELATKLEPVLRDTVLIEDIELTIDNDGNVDLAKRQI